MKQTVGEEKHHFNDHIKKSKEPLLKEVNQGKLLKTIKVKAEYRKQTFENQFINRKTSQYMINT